MLVAIPALNEERFIGSLVHEVLLAGFSCLVIDDGSTDHTPDIAAAAGAMVERHGQNRGKAAALNTAFDVARNGGGYEVLVAMDGDWQHDPREIDDLIEPIRAGRADIVSGSRFIEGARGRIPSVRKMGQRIVTRTSNAVSGTLMTDTLSGFRAFSRHAIDGLHFKSAGFSVEMEMQFMAQAQGLRQLEIPITARYDDPPKRNIIGYGMVVIDGLLRLTARYRPLLFFGVPSMTLLVAGVLFGALVIDIYDRVRIVAAGYALLTVLLIVLGAIGLFAAILLHVLRGIFLDLEGEIRQIARTPSGDRPGR